MSINSWNVGRKRRKTEIQRTVWERIEPDLMTTMQKINRNGIERVYNDEGNNSEKEIEEMGKSNDERRIEHHSGTWNFCSRLDKFDELSIQKMSMLFKDMDKIGSKVDVDRQMPDELIKQSIPCQTELLIDNAAILKNEKITCEVSTTKSDELEKKRLQRIRFRTSIAGYKKFESFWNQHVEIENECFVIMRRDIYNRFDANAVKLHLYSPKFESLGFLPAFLAKLVSPLLEASESFGILGRIFFEPGVKIVPSIDIIAQFEIPLQFYSLPSLAKTEKLSIQQSVSGLDQLIHPQSKKFPFIASFLLEENGESYTSTQRQLSHFQNIVETILTRYACIFEEQELKKIQDFLNQLCPASKAFLFKLLNRKPVWFAVEQLLKREVNCSALLEQLTRFGFIYSLKDIYLRSQSVTSVEDGVTYNLGSKLELFSSLLAVLPVVSLKAIIDKLGLDKKLKNEKRENLINLLLQGIKKQKTILGGNLLESKQFYINVSKICGDWVKLDEPFLRTFQSLTYLSHYNFGNWSAFYAQEYGRVNYFSYKIRFQNPLFLNRQHFNEYFLACEFLREVEEVAREENLDNVEQLMKVCLLRLGIFNFDARDSLMPASNFSICFPFASKQELLDSLLVQTIPQNADSFFLTRLRFIPLFLYVESFYCLLKIYEKNKQYEMACKLANIFLHVVECEQIEIKDCDDECTIVEPHAKPFSTFLYMSNGMEASRLLIFKLHPRRGKIWYRQILNLTSHLKEHRLAYQQCLIALNERCLRAGFCISVCHRAQKLHEKLKMPKWNFPLISELVEEIPVRTIFGRPINKKNSQKSCFFGLDDELCSVEELVLQYYAKDGWRGLHTESSIWSTLFGLFFFDVIFSPLEDAFHHELQDAPLDFENWGFYCRRESEILQILQSLRNGEFKTLLDSAFLHEGTNVAGLQWGLYTKEELLICCNGVGGHFLAEIFSILVKDRHWLAGLPDLLLMKDGKGILCEVKGPRDKLSDQQKAWLLCLHKKLGIEVIVCYVRETETNMHTTSDSDHGHGS